MSKSGFSVIVLQALIVITNFTNFVSTKQDKEQNRVDRFIDIVVKIFSDVGLGSKVLKNVIIMC